MCLSAVKAATHCDLPMPAQPPSFVFRHSSFFFSLYSFFSFLWSFYPELLIPSSLSFELLFSHSSSSLLLHLQPSTSPSRHPCHPPPHLFSLPSTSWSTSPRLTISPNPSPISLPAYSLLFSRFPLFEPLFSRFDLFFSSIDSPSPPRLFCRQYAHLSRCPR